MAQISKFLSILILFAFSLVAVPAAAKSVSPIAPPEVCDQPEGPEKGRPGHFNPEKFKKDLSEYVTRAAGLTCDEAKKFFPVYFEYKDKQRNLEHQKGRSLRAAADQNMNDRDCKRILKNIVELDEKLARIEEQYFARFEKIVGPKKFLKVLVAERSFGRETFRKMTK